LSYEFWDGRDRKEDEEEKKRNHRQGSLLYMIGNIIAIGDASTPVVGKEPMTGGLAVSFLCNKAMRGWFKR
jgi:hypothetical protein